MTSVHQEQGYGGSSQPVTVSGESRSGWFPPQVADQATGKEAAAGQPASLLNCFLIHEIILSSIQLYRGVRTLLSIYQPLTPIAISILYESKK